MKIVVLLAKYLISLYVYFVTSTIFSLIINAKKEFSTIFYFVKSIQKQRINARSVLETWSFNFFKKKLSALKKYKTVKFMIIITKMNLSVKNALNSIFQASLIKQYVFREIYFDVMNMKIFQFFKNVKFVKMDTWKMKLEIFVLSTEIY